MSARENSSTWPIFLAVWCSFFLYCAIAAPVPAVNEPHYLCKARHFWQPDWCDQDFFLRSTNAHTVFFATIGSLTTFLSLEQTAWTGRALAILVLTAGWCRLLSTVSSLRWSALQTCWLFLLLTSIGNLSGEWLVGGVEGKVFAYGFLFSALGHVASGRIVRAGGLAGLAIAFHPVIGVWGLLSFAGSELVRHRFWAIWRFNVLFPLATNVRSRLLSIVVLIACALPGLIPVLKLLAEPVPNSIKNSAAYIQVYYRLAHHLDPMRFPPRAYLGYGTLLIIWIIVMRLRKQRVHDTVPAATTSTTQVDLANNQLRLDLIVGFAILFALGGLAVGWGPRPAQLMAWYIPRAQLLKFYPFRLADVLIPIAVSMGIVNTINVMGVDRTKVFLGCGLLAVAALFRAHSMCEVNRYSGALRADWIDGCRWIDAHLPSDALIHTPHNGWAFKWFAQRAEYVNFKDCPQDAAGIVEWNRRLNFLKRWFESHYDDRFYSADELRQLRKETEITHIFTDRLGPMGIEPVFQNATFQVYDLTSLD
ncbi:MAG: hypothetical protein JSS49_09355 [Planctomycetes bacterium]|nr:hypothetical protein [Planctomycetota bacterium]